MCRTYAEYCTYAQNGISFYGVYEEICETPHSPPEPAWSKIFVQNSIVTDSSNHIGLYYVDNSYFPEFSSLYSDDPCFVDTTIWDYHLADTSPYIDQGFFGYWDSYTYFELPPGPIYGPAPDLGAFENTFGHDFFFNPIFEDDYFISVSTMINDTSHYPRKLVTNVGNIPPDSFKVIVNPPYAIDSLSGGSFANGIPVYTHFQFTPTHENYCGIIDSLIFEWWLDGLHGRKGIGLTGSFNVDIALAGTLYACGPTIVLWTGFEVLDTNTLFIEPSSSIYNRGTCEFDIYGDLLAHGTTTEKINFYTHDRYYSTAPRFKFRGGSSGEFTNCDFTGFSIDADISELLFEQCNFSALTETKGQASFRLKNTTATFRDCVFDSLWDVSCPAGSLARSNVVFERCIFKNCQMNSDGSTYPGTMLIYESLVTFKDCIFMDNTVEGIDTTSFTYPNEAFLAGSSNITAINCIFKNDDPGSISPNIIKLINCNFIDIDSIGHDGSISALNCIFINNNILFEVNNCLITPGYEVSDSSSVIFGTPSFASDTSYQLLPTSIGIDLGAEFAVTGIGDTIWAPTTDYYGNPRPSGAGFDIGVHEYQWDGFEHSVFFLELSRSEVIISADSQKITVTNSSILPIDLGLSVDSIQYFTLLDSFYDPEADTAHAFCYGCYSLMAIFADSLFSPTADSFDADDFVTYDTTFADSRIFGPGGYNVAPGGSVYLWFRFDAPEVYPHNSLAVPVKLHIREIAE